MYHINLLKKEEPETLSEIVLDLFGKPQLPKSLMEETIIHSITDPDEGFHFEGLTREEVEQKLRNLSGALSRAGEMVEVSRQSYENLLLYQENLIKEKWELQKQLIPVLKIAPRRVTKPAFNPELRDALLFLTPEEIREIVHAHQAQKNEVGEEEEEEVIEDV